ncbi:putative methylase/helicase [Bradyrhizobium cosmicum]|uniref:Methylase/helicase n=1 Tax=Bradyrhizobium cosmicum TaxID=1404864 RepID=A0AAI8MER5_9BRAD|nr:putative methylase/helicase [Bradyrhizobium cosmicum]
MPESEKDVLRRRLANYPREALEFFRNGFAATAGLDEKKRSEVLAQLIERFKSGGRRIDGEEIAELAGLSKRDADSVAGAYTIVIGLLSESKATPEDFIEAAKDVFVPPEYADVAIWMARSVCADRDAITSVVERTALTSAVLPSLMLFNTAIDLRLRIVDGKVQAAAPVVLVHLDTDGEGQEIWFQMASADVQMVIKRLNKALDDMKIAEKLGPA